MAAAKCAEKVLIPLSGESNTPLARMVFPPKQHHRCFGLGEEVGDKGLRDVASRC